MSSARENRDSACFLLTKHSWRGKYKRIFSVGSHGVTTYHPENLRDTNYWPYADISNVQAIRAAPQRLAIICRKEGKARTIEFSTEHRSQLLTELLRQRAHFEKPKEIMRYKAKKHHWSDTLLPVFLEVTQYSLDQLDPATNHVLASYCYKDITGLLTVNDCPGGFIIACGNFSRLHFFVASNFEDILQKIQEQAQANLGIGIRVLKDRVTVEEFQCQRFGTFRDDEHQTSISEFIVNKIYPVRYSEAQRRILCLTETCLLERDPQSYIICTLRPLGEIYALVRDNDNPQLFSIEYINGQVRTYTTTDRDSLLASVLDGVRASGNRDVHVTMLPTVKGYRLGPLHAHVDEDTESMHLRYLQNAQQKPNFPEMVRRFNANIPYSGLLYSVTQDGIFSENKDKLITGALQALVHKEASDCSAGELEAQFQALRRLVASKVGFSAFTSLPNFREAVGTKVITALRRDDYAVAHSAIDMICALMHPMHDDYDLKQEQDNKRSLLATRTFLESLLAMWTRHVEHGTAALIVCAMLDLLTFALCVPYSETTDGKQFDELLEMVAAKGRVLFRLFEHPSMAVVKGVGLVMRALIEEGEPEVAARMQHLALAEGTLLRHLSSALFTTASDARMLAHRQLARHLVGLWVTGNATAMSLLKRIVPCGLLACLDSDERVTDLEEREMLDHRDNLKVAQEQQSRSARNPNLVALERQLKMLDKRLERYSNLVLQHWGVRIERKEALKPVLLLRRRRERVKTDSNWRLFYREFAKDQARPDLIWNHRTREELRNALENEIRAFEGDRELAGKVQVAWNHREFELSYPSLAEEVKIGDYYLRLLLEANDEGDSSIRRFYEFFNDLYHRFLLTTKLEMKCMCLQAMAIVYGKYFEDIGPFADTKFLVGKLNKCTDKSERDRIVLFIHKLVRHPRNVRDFMEAKGVRILVDMLTLAHMHTSRAVVPTQTNVIEASPNSMLELPKEWYYTSDDTDKHGPVSFIELKELYAKDRLSDRTKCWAQGLDAWRTVVQLPQLRWCLLAKGNAVLNESELATLILNIFIQTCEFYPSRNADGSIVRPLPKIKRLLTEPPCLSHLVQLLLTFDPVLVEKVATLLCEIIQDNPEISKVYLTGVFYFILMYTGSNVLPIAKFLQITHMKQAFRSEDSVSSDIMQRSILGQLLPEAMVNYLENHGAEKFAQIFLGEFDTPEAIWSAEMRRMLIEKIAGHIADFSPRLRSHTMARYHYIPMPAVRYPQLEKELFCNIFYLRHLCDTSRFPDWPVKDPVGLLKDILEAWKREVEKKPPSMTVAEAYAELELQPERSHEDAAVRKAYYRLAQQFHPDKNPEGRDRFQRVSQAYEFLCSRSSWSADGPDPNNIVLVLKAQSILFERFSEDLKPYKYAGYPQLVKTIMLESADEQLFSKSAPLLAAASELAYHTVHCSALNAEELRREKGLEVLLEAYSRCVSVLNKSTKPAEVSAQVCEHITRCYSVAAQFPGCRDRMVDLPQLVKDLCRILHFKHLTKLCSVATECVGALSIDSILQMQLLQAGALWHLLLFVFDYDFTLEEGGVERSESANQQEISNRLAKLAVKACACLGGFGETATPPNSVTVCSLENLLTPYLARKLADAEPEKLLKTLNSNSSTPYLIWDNGTRAELCEYLRAKLTNNEPPESSEAAYGADFQFGAHENELKIGGVYIRIYNEQPTFPIEHPKDFVGRILDFLVQQSSQLLSLADVAFSVSMEERLRHTVMALHALRNVVKNSAGVEGQCISHFRLLFALLNVPSEPVQRAALEVVHLVTANNDCINDIAATEVLGHLLLLLHSLADCQVQVLQVLYALSTSTKLVKEAYAKGAIIYLLDIFCNSSSEQLRQQAAECLARMCSDKLVGPKVRLTLGRFLPEVFADAMRENPPQCVNMFETEHEHPELIWDADYKERVCRATARLRVEHQNAQLNDINATWRAPDKDVVVGIGKSDEVVVGGVYLRLFISNPAWTLRHPKQFLSELMETCLSNMTKEKPSVERLELCTGALCALLQAQPSLSDSVPALGHIPRLCLQMANDKHDKSVPKAAILVLHQLALSNVCMTAISHTEYMKPLKKAMEIRKDLIGVACETLHRLFVNGNNEQLIKQALDADMISHLLTLLDARLELLDNPSMTKAQIAKALKSMSRSSLYGDRINAILEKSSVWNDYKQQRHDLFITNTNVSGYLTGATPSSAGYLTQGPTKTAPTAPPPVIDNKSADLF